MKNENALASAEKWLKNRNTSEYVAGGNYERELLYYTWYLEHHCNDGEDVDRAILDATDGREMYAFALENPVENEEFDMLFGKPSSEAEARAYYKMAVKNYFVNYYKYSEDGCNEDDVRKTFDKIWSAAEDMIKDTIPKYSVEKMTKQLRKLSSMLGNAEYEARMAERKRAEILESMGWTQKAPEMTLAHFVDRYDPRRVDGGKIQITNIGVDRDERDAVMHYIDNHRNEILAVIDEREKIESEVYAMAESKDEQEFLSMDGLRTALQRYDENGKRGKCGPWEIHDGGYDSWWEIAYEGNVLVACHASGEYSNDAREFGNIEREQHLADKTFSDICKIVCEEFPECRMAPKEQQKINENKQSFKR